MKLFSKKDAIICLDCLANLSGLFVAIIATQLIFGCCMGRWENISECKSNPAKIEYIFFGYRLGCWAGQP